MCGIAGWVHARPGGPLELDERQSGEVLAAMTATMACRGPDAEHEWLDAQAALGHRRLAVIDLETGDQPMTVTDAGRTAAALTYSGEVYNFLELREELAGAGHRFVTQSDTEVILHAYLQWGPSMVERLNGMFAFALWDPTKGQLLLARDRMGVKPLYWYPTPDGLLFGSEPKAILAHPAVRSAVDADGLRELLTFVKTPGVAAFKGMHELRPGHLLLCRPEGTTVSAYWKLEAIEHTDDLDTTINHVRELLDDIVTRQLIADVPLCSLLSGGLDSSAITALAAGQLAQAGEGPVRSFAVDFVGYAEGFQADEMRDTPDAPFVHELAEQVGADHRDIVLSTEQLMDRELRRDALHAADLPTARGDIYTSLLALFRAVREQSTVALSGESADEVFGGYRWFHDPEVVAAPTFPWLARNMAAMSQEGDGPASLLAPDVLATLDLPTFRADAYRDALAEVPHLSDQSPQERRMREICYFHLTRFVQHLLDRKDRMSMATGLEVRVPFCDHRLVQYVFNTPWAMKTFDGREKSLLRAATADVLPRSIIERKKSPYPTTQDVTYEQALHRAVLDLLKGEDTPVLPLLDPARVREITSQPGEPELHQLRPHLETVLAFDTWLRDYDVALELERS